MQKRDSSHLKVQKMARIRDNNTCQICGSKTHTAGHHAIDYQFGGKAATDNIVTLCSGCHRKVHNGNMDIFCFN